MKKVQKYLTRKGKAQIEEKLAFLKVNKREEIGERLRVARGFGDLSENSEYDDAKNAQAENEREIERLEGILKHAIFVDDDDIPHDVVFIGSKVTLYNTDTKEEQTYEIVGSGEADPFVNRISNESPLGMALMHKKVDDEVEVVFPAGKANYKILDIAR